jgi:hypothetical protein
MTCTEAETARKSVCVVWSLFCFYFISIFLQSFPPPPPPPLPRALAPSRPHALTPSRPHTPLFYLGVQTFGPAIKYLRP